MLFLIELFFVTILSFFTAVTCVLFIVGLNFVTQFHISHPQILYALPLGGFLIVWLYKKLGKSGSHLGNTYIARELKKNTPEISRSLTPLIFVTSLITHLFGGSSGREGVGVQIGVGFSSVVKKLFPQGGLHTNCKTLLLCGTGAGFSAIFGTPLSALFFSFEISQWKNLNLRRGILIALSAYFSFLVTKIF